MSMATIKDPASSGNVSITVNEKNAKELTDNIINDKPGNIPFYGTGARALIKIGGSTLAVCQSLTWSISYQANPIVTIDTVVPWDIDVGPLNVTASLSRITDPTKGPEVDFLLPIMASAVHHPFVEMQVLDALGTNIFFARGMFMSISSGVTRGAVSSINASFSGVAYQHYVAQTFHPYSSIASGLSGLVNGLGNLASSVTGGVL